MAGPQPKVVVRRSRDFPCKYCGRPVFFGARVKEFTAPSILANADDWVMHSISCAGAAEHIRDLRSPLGVAGEPVVDESLSASRKSKSVCGRCGHRNNVSIKAFTRRTRPKCFKCGEPLLPSEALDKRIRARAMSRRGTKPQ